VDDECDLVVFSSPLAIFVGEALCTGDSNMD